MVNLGRERYSTPVIKKSVNPEYPAEKATFDFPIYRSNAGYLGALEFVVWDKDLLRKDYIGEAAIPFDEWFKHHEPSPAFAFDDQRNTVSETRLTIEASPSLINHSAFSLSQSRSFQVGRTPKLRAQFN